MKSARKPQRRSKPPLSVVMPVHNALPYLDDAIASILNQTFSDFEFAIFDDGSTDGSTEKLREWALRDSRIRLIETATNLGPVLSSQRVAAAAKAPIIARMDADDLCHPDRLRQQLDVLREYPDAGLVACLCDVIDREGRNIRGPDLWRLLRKSPMAPFPHGAIMYRRDAFDAVGGYRSECEYWEDQDLVVRMSVISTIMVIPHSLYVVRQTPTSTRLTAARKRQESAVNSMYRFLAALSQDPTGEFCPFENEKLDPRVFVSLGSAELWAGGRPRLFRRLLRRGKLSPLRRSLGPAIWTLWASASPSTLKAVASAIYQARNAVARDRLDLNRPVPWSPVSGSNVDLNASLAVHADPKKRASIR
jgi:glycosyltransferase involved in cell wall biosynthesis